MWVLLQVVKLPANRSAVFSVWSAAVEENQFVAFATNTKVGRYGKAVCQVHPVAIVSGCTPRFGFSSAAMALKKGTYKIPNPNNGAPDGDARNWEQS